MPLSYFTPDDDGVLHPTRVALSLWSEDQLHGVAVSSVLAGRWRRGCGTRGGQTSGRRA